MDALYQEKILAFAKSTREQTPLAAPTHTALVSNPTCGDRVDLKLHIDGDTIHHASADIRGCALCEAGAGLFLSISSTLSVARLEATHDTLAAWLAGDDLVDIPDEMQVFEPVRAIKNRHKCVTLAFEASVKAVSNDQGETIT